MFGLNALKEVLDRQGVIAPGQAIIRRIERQPYLSNLQTL